MAPLTFFRWKIWKSILKFFYVTGSLLKLLTFITVKILKQLIFHWELVKRVIVNNKKFHFKNSITTSRSIYFSMCRKKLLHFMPDSNYFHIVILNIARPQNLDLWKNTLWTKQKMAVSSNVFYGICLRGISKSNLPVPMPDKKRKAT